MKTEQEIREKLTEIIELENGTKDFDFKYKLMLFKSFIFWVLDEYPHSFLDEIKE